MSSEPDSLKRRTKSTTYRLPEDMLKKLDSLATQEEVSQNVLVKQILDSHLRWEVSATKAGWVVMPRAILMNIMNELDEKTIIKISSETAKIVHKSIILLMQDKYDFDGWIQVVRDRCKRSGFYLKETTTAAGKTTLIMHHDLGEKWSVFFKAYYQEMLHELGLAPTFDYTDSTLVVSVER